jgi:6-pyruvoyltetrahydropterin/6-carboxytetrahydropterin synthase
MDFGDVRKAAEPLRQRLDHHYLNEIPGLENPTSENLAKYIWNDLVNEIPISKVIVQETCTSGCEYSES